MGNVGGSVTGIVRARSQKVGCVPKKIYECVNYRKYGKSRCVCHNIREDRLVANFKQFLILVKENYEQEINHLKLEEYQSSKGKSLKGLKIDLENLKTEYKIIIAEKIKELSSCQLEKRRLLENTYAMLEDEKYKEIVHVKRQTKELEKEDLKLLHSCLVNINTEKLNILHSILENMK